MPRVLVVDDSDDTTVSFCLLLGLWGYEALAAKDGPSALALAADFPPDVALVDLVMPGMSGLEVAHRLRRLPGLQRALIIAVSGVPGAARGSPEGDFDFSLLKPVDPGELRRLLDALTASRLGQTAGAAADAQARLLAIVGATLQAVTESSQLSRESRDTAVEVRQLTRETRSLCQETRRLWAGRGA